MAAFYPGQRVRIKSDAFGNSQEPDDIYARGKVGQLLELLDDDLWRWRDDTGREAFPITSELEMVFEPGAYITPTVS